MEERVYGPRFGRYFNALSELPQRLRDRVVRRFRPQWIRQAVYATPSLYENFAPLRHLRDLPAGQQLSVIAPHPDDESIGAGGLIALWRAAGRQASVVFLTDGAAGNPALRKADLSAEARKALMQQTAQGRRAEAELALQRLDARGQWLSGTDGGLWRDEVRLQSEVTTLWRAAPPDLLAVPFPADRHQDHAVAARIAAVAGLAALSPQTPVLCYELWSPCPANAVLDISAVAATKERAIAAHASQLNSTDYLGAARGLAQYRAITAGLPSGALAEAFHQCTLAELGRLCDRLRV